VKTILIAVAAVAVAVLVLKRKDIFRLHLDGTNAPPAGVIAF
jgi:hypothetical protein